MLQVFDEGYLTDSSGNLINFKNTIIIMTSNISSQMEIDDLTGEELNILLKNEFSNEFLNRIDEIILFNDLSMEDMEDILKLEINKLSKRVKEEGFKLKVEADAIDYILSLDMDKSFGARPLKRAIQKYIENPLAKKLIEEETREGTRIKISLEDSHIEIALFK